MDNRYYQVSLTVGLNILCASVSVCHHFPDILPLLCDSYTHEWILKLLDINDVHAKVGIGAYSNVFKPKPLNTT